MDDYIGSLELDPHRFSQRRVCELTRLSATEIRRLVRSGRLRPVRLTSREMYYSWEEIAPLVPTELRLAGEAAALRLSATPAREQAGSADRR